MRADKAGYSLPGFPNQRIVKVERFVREKSSTGSPDGRSWVRIITDSRSFEYPPDWPVEVFTDTDDDLEDEHG